jgi:uncharacterized membrane protein YjfL (UPF0719 family)
MLENVGLILAYSGVGIAILVMGFMVLDFLTPGKLGHLVMERNPNAALLAATSLASLGLILFFAIFFVPATGNDVSDTGAVSWNGLDDVFVYGVVGVGVQAIGFFVLDILTPGKLGVTCFEERFHTASWVTASVNLATALIVCASLT